MSYQTVEKYQFNQTILFNYCFQLFFFFLVILVHIWKVESADSYLYVWIHWFILVRNRSFWNSEKCDCWISSSFFCLAGSVEKEKGSGQHLLKISYCHCPRERDLVLVNMDSSVFWQEGRGLDPKFNNYLYILFEPLIRIKETHKMPSHFKVVGLVLL